MAQLIISHGTLIATTQLRVTRFVTILSHLTQEGLTVNMEKKYGKSLAPKIDVPPPVIDSLIMANMIKV